MVKKKKKSLEQQKQDLVGFEGILDLIPETKHLKQEVKQGQITENYQIINYYEHETKRLESLETIFKDKLRGLKESSQTEKILEKQLIQKERLHDELLEDMDNIDHPCWQHLGQIWKLLH